MAWGGRREGSGRKPGNTNKIGQPHLRRWRRATAEQILDGADEVGLWRKLLSGKDKWLALAALKYLTDRRDGKAYQGMNPLQAQRLTAGDDPKLAAVLKNLLPQSATITLTEKEMRIEALENNNIEAKAKLTGTTLRTTPDSPLTLDAATASENDPSSHEEGVGHFAREAHTERNQNSGEKC